jgi:nucleoside phosphorylase
MSPMVPTYFSHSYRRDDRALNEAFFEHFWNRGFAFTVDPKSTTPTIPHLEVMMQRSAAFVAVAPLREDVPRYLTSPFIAYECGLAEQANLPSVVFIEAGVADGPFDKDAIITFDRRDIAASLDREQQRIETLYERSRPYYAAAVRSRGPVGLWFPSVRRYRSIIPLVKELLDAAGYTPELVRTDYEDPWRLLIDLRKYDFVIADVGSVVTDLRGPALPVLYGAFIPTIKLLPDLEGALPPLATSRALRAADAEKDAVIRWSTPEDLIDQLAVQLEKLARPRSQFRTREEGLKYIRSLGRPAEGRVFISNAGPDNDLARRVVQMLSLYNIEPFHYIYNNSIERGVEYAEPLRKLVTSSSLFIPLISQNYWQSAWCRDEYELATRMHEAQRLRIVPYFLDAVGAHDVTFQGETVAGLNMDEQASKIVTGIEKLVTAPPAEVLGPRPGPAVASQRGIVDVAIVTVLPEEYKAVRSRLDHPVTLLGDETTPNMYAWDLGSVASPRHANPYRVVVALAGRPGTSSGLQTVTATVRAFEPRYVLLVGIAGGLSEVGLGDVVVSDVIVGYEYAKITGGKLQPRTNWTHSTDTAILTAAEAVSSRSPDWHAGLRGPDGQLSTPKVVVGMVGSGNKVADDVEAPAFVPVMDTWPKLVAVEMEGLGAAEAVEQLRQTRHNVNFAMVRGISDLPLGSQAAAASPVAAAGQSAQRDTNKDLAAAAAAEFTVHLLRETWPVPPLMTALTP